MTEPLKDEIEQWLTIAESDFQAYKILASSDKPPTMEVCFHCQQYVEKLLKAVLTFNKEEIPKTHDLKNLAVAASQYVPEMKTLIDSIAELTIYGSKIRYPAIIQIGNAEMKQVIVVATEIGALLKKYLSQNGK
jgi:HEPN domain-containing protein